MWIKIWTKHFFCSLATARQAAKEMAGNNGQTVNGVSRYGHKIKAHGGLNEKEANPQGASGKVASEKEL